MPKRKAEPVLNSVALIGDRFCRAGGYRGLGQSRLFVGRSFLTTAAALSGSGSSHCYFFAILRLRVAPYLLVLSSSTWATT